MHIESVEIVKPVKNVETNCSSPTGVLVNSAGPQNPYVPQHRKKKSSISCPQPPDPGGYLGCMETAKPARN
jgi:hypothetical protein